MAKQLSQSLKAIEYGSMRAPSALCLRGALWCLIFEFWLTYVYAKDGGRALVQSGSDLLHPMSHTKHCGPSDLLVSRPHSVSITEFGGVGDGKTLNTHSFENAIFYLRTFAEKGGAQLYIPPGKWLTGSFSLTSHLTLHLDDGADIIGTQDISKWPLVDPLPSYGRGRELPGKRHMSLIYGENLKDVVITGANGTIDGSGSVWWELFNNGSLDHTRPHLVEFMNSEDILFYNVTFRNSPFWTLHPVYSRNVVFRDLTILAPHDSPNTDGIDPDSSTNVCIEDCYISVGDDAISIKSGWDEYGIAYGKPSANISIHNIVAITPTSAGIAIGSEMSGGVSNVKVTNLAIFNSRRGFRLKTGAGRGGFVTNISISDVSMINVSTALAFTGQYGGHPDDHYDPKAYPYVDQIFIKNVVGLDIKEAGTLFGISEAPFRNICLADIVLDVWGAVNWSCSDVEGSYKDVIPLPCSELLKDSGQSLSTCSRRRQSGGCLHTSE